MEWLDISTAPKTGEWVLLWLGVPWSKVEKAYWYEEWGNWQTEPVDHSVDEYGGIGALVPTAWMPLPKPPAM